MAHLYPNSEDLRGVIWFQQDELPAHYVRPVRDYSDTMMDGLVDESFLKLSARSPIDFFFEVLQFLQFLLILLLCVLCVKVLLN